MMSGLSRQYTSPLTMTLTHFVTICEYVNWPLKFSQGHRIEETHDAGRLPKVERRPPLLIQ